MKKSYQAPKLIVHGTVGELTQGNGSGNFTDKVFPDKTPKPQLTFS